MNQKESLLNLKWKHLRQIGILRWGSSEFFLPIMLIKKSHSGAKLAKSPAYHLVVNYKYMNSHLPDIKFSYPEIKHVLHKICRHSSHVFSIIDLKQAFHFTNLTEESQQYTSCCASPGSPNYQFNKCVPGLFHFVDEWPALRITIWDMRIYWYNLFLHLTLKLIKMSLSTSCSSWKNMICFWP